MSVRNFELFGGNYGNTYLWKLPWLGAACACIPAAAPAGLPLSLGLIFVVLGYRTVLSQVLKPLPYYL